MEKSDYSSEDSYEDDPNELLADHDFREPQQVLTDIYKNLFNALFSDYDYGSGSYWDNRYKEKEEEYEWFLSWDSIFPHVSSYLQLPIENCLNIGCGNSPMSNDMLKNNILHITNIDISDSVIKQMKNEHKDEKRLEWYTMSCMELNFPDNNFDLVIDKGTIDALYCNKSYLADIETTVREISRTLKKGCKYICISYGDEDIRSDFIKITSIHINYKGKQKMLSSNGNIHFAYIFEKAR